MGRPQVSARADLGRRCLAVPVHAWGWPSPARSCAGTRMPTGGSASARRSSARVPFAGSALVHVLLGGPIIAGADALAVLRAARVRDPGAPDRAGGPAPVAGAAARHQRVADARDAWSIARPTASATRKRSAKDGVPFFPVAARKDMVGMGVVVLARAGLRRDLRAPWPEGRAGSHHHRHRAEAGLLLPGPLCAVRAAAALDRDGGPAASALRSPSGSCWLLPFLAGTGRRAGGAGRSPCWACS